MLRAALSPPTEAVPDQMDEGDFASQLIEATSWYAGPIFHTADAHMQNREVKW